MNKVQIYENQSLLDLAMQTTGEASNAIFIAKANDMAISDEVEAGTELIIPELIINDDIKRYYEANKVLPATALTQEQKDEVIGCEGIGCWAIGVDFVVS